MNFFLITKKKHKKRQKKRITTQYATKLSRFDTKSDRIVLYKNNTDKCNKQIWVFILLVFCIFIKNLIFFSISIEKKRKFAPSTS